MHPTVGILALQGDFDSHRVALERAGAHAIEVRSARQLDVCDGLILPGGESTTILKLLDRENLLEPLREFAARKPLFGTCAGAILLAREVSHPAQPGLALIDIAIERNAYGRQVDSHIAQIELEAGGEFLAATGPARPASGSESLRQPPAPGSVVPASYAIEAVFIRAPIIRRVGPSARVLARHNGDPVWVEQGLHMVTTFHPELAAGARVHQYFVDKLP